MAREPVLAVAFGEAYDFGPDVADEGLAFRLAEKVVDVAKDVEENLVVATEADCAVGR